MKVLQVLSSVDPAGGGVVESVKQVSLELIRLGHAVEFLTLDGPQSDWLADFPLPLTPTGPSYAGFGYNNRCCRFLRAHRRSFDAVVVHGLWQYHGLASWRALAGTDTPYFVFTHGMLDPWFKRTYPLKHLKKCLYWPWGDYRLLRDAAAVIFTCEEERLLARQSFRLYQANEAVTTLGTAPPPQAKAKAFLDAHERLRDKRVVLFLSRIHEKKGCDLLLEAFAQVATADERLRLVIAGPDQTGWVASLHERAERLGIDERVTWPGMLQGEMKWAAFQAGEIFCLPSHQENFGIVVAEALGCGKPVLISSKVNIWREIEADGAGFVDEDTVDGTARNLVRWLALDAQEYSAMSTRARQCFASRFEIQRAAERLLEIIQRLGR